MKHLTIYVLCLFITPIYAEKGIRAQLNKEITTESRIKSASEKFNEAKILQKSAKTVEKFTWDEALNKWVFTGSIESNFSTNGSLQEELEYDKDGLVYKRTVYTIDNTSLIASIIYDDFVNGNWVHQQKSETEKDLHGNIIRDEYFFWNENEWKLVSGKKTITEIVNTNLSYETDWVLDDNTKVYTPILQRIITSNNSNVSEIITQSYENNTWVNTYAEGYDYDVNGQISEVFYLTWEGNQWRNEELYTNIVWHDYNKQLLSYVELKRWQDNSWVNNQKAIYQYKLNGGQSSISFIYVNNEWVYSYRLNEDYDMHNNPKNFKVEMFEDSVWVTLLETEMDYTYDQQNRLVEAIIKIYDGNTWHNLSKEKIIYKTNTGITKEKLALSIYPNPTTDYFQLNMKEASAGTLNIYNTQGQLLISQHIDNTNDKRVDLSEFTPGTYIVNFICGYEVLVAKVVKE